MELVPDMYPLIYAYIKEDYKTTVSWFLCCRRFNDMVTVDTKRLYSSPVVISPIGPYWDGPVARLATYQGKVGVLRRTMDYETLKPQDYPVEVWEKILSDTTGDDWADMETKDYCISQEQDFSTPGSLLFSERLTWHVYAKQRFTFYTRESLTREAALDALYDYHKIKVFRPVAEFVVDEIQWGENYKCSYTATGYYQ